MVSCKCIKCFYFIHITVGTHMLITANTGIIAYFGQFNYLIEHLIL